MPLCPADESFAQFLENSLPKDTVRKAEARYLEDPRGRWPGTSQYVALPRNPQEVAQIVKACGKSSVGLTPYSGGTGLVGGQIPNSGSAPLLLSLERMNKIRGTYPEENAMVAEAGCILADVQSAAEAAGRLFPLSLASEGSARIGGLLSTNAGGVNVLRYGNARELVLGLEAVLPDGQIWNGLKRLRKDNTGYDLRHLLMGAEGTLGVITAASLKLAPRPAATGTALLTVTDPQAALSLLSMARDQIGEGISAFELLHRTGFDFLAATLPEIRQPWQTAPEWCVLIELGLSIGQSPQDALERLFTEAHEAGLVQDGLIAQSGQQSQDFWNLREHFPEANKRIGSVASHDISLPLSVIPEFITQATEALNQIGTWRINCFGHLGDGNLHFNIFPPDGSTKDALKSRSAELTALVHDLTHEMGGSVSAEHGIGRHKVADLEKYGDPAKLWAMRAIKDALDPVGIMNPGAVLRDKNA
ncbi:FAD-binding oxidoreductase [Primorskyibacter sp. 2E233]|uniref:FAD-binding oxidoreductase n=1 Tax=Primorskyibacter sp. 2E233 TaxID=3413431 RepID=UPI003BF0699E